MRRLLLGTAVLGLAMAACGGDGSRAEAAALPDGRHFGYIEALQESTLEFDAAEFLTGAEATEAAVADGAIEAGEPVPNDY